MSHDEQAGSACPLPKSHGRLQQAHVLWHQALLTYDDEPAFRANLNGLIEALRNTTFMLQAEKAVMPQFDDWYEAWRKRMRLDAVLSWLVGARTRVVHQSDLATRSTAHAVVHTNLSLATVEMELPPLLATPVACRLIVDKLPEPFASDRRNLVLSVERRWSVPELDGRELLDALAHAYGFLAQLIREAHDQVGAPFDMREPHEKEDAAPDGRLACMITTSEARTVRLSLENGRWLRSELIREPSDPALAAEAARRYGVGTPDKKVSLPNEPVARAEALVELAKRMLVKDKAHVRVMFLRIAGDWKMIEIRAADRAEKYTIMRLVAELVRRHGADAVIEIGEAWLRFAPADLQIRPEDDPIKEEVLYVTVATADGVARQYITPFKRSLFGRIKLQDTFTLDEGQATYFGPILEAWGLSLPDDPEQSGT